METSRYLSNEDTRQFIAGSDDSPVSVGEVGVAVGDRVEPRLGTERGEPRGPDVRRHEVPVGTRFEGDLQQVAGVEAEDRPAVRAEVADPPEGGVEPGDRVQVGQVDQVVHLAGAVVALVDRRDLDGEHEPHIGRAQVRRQPLADVGFALRAQPVHARLGRYERLAQVVVPRRMGEVAGAEQRDALALGPPGERVEGQVTATGA